MEAEERKRKCKYAGQCSLSEVGEWKGKRADGFQVLNESPMVHFQKHF